MRNTTDKSYYSYLVLRTISISGGIYVEISQNNESSCLTLVALVHCVLRETSLSLDPQKPHFRLKSHSCSNLH
jgi:hypothetical protein